MNNKLYYFSRNLLVFIVSLIILPLYWITGIIYLFSFLFIVDGSAILELPHKWDWNIWEK